MKRQEFIKLSSLMALTASSCVNGILDRKPLTKSIKLEMIISKDSIKNKFMFLKAAGFQGVALNSSSYKQVELQEAKKMSGLIINSVNYREGWSKPLSHVQQSVRSDAVRGLSKAIAEAASLGAPMVVANPGVRCTGEDFATVSNRAFTAIVKVIPLLEKYKVKLALENLWNNFLQTPKELKAFVSRFEHPLIGVCLDTGNAGRFGPLDEWFALLKDRIFNVHLQNYIKEGHSQSHWMKLKPVRDNSQASYIQEKYGYNGGYVIDGYGGGEMELLEVSKSF